MSLHTDRQRKFFFANRGNPRSSVTPEMQKFLSKKISKNIREGKSPKQATAIAFSQARKKFGNGRLKRKT